MLEKDRELFHPQSFQLQNDGMRCGGGAWLRFFWRLRQGLGIEMTGLEVLWDACTLSTARKKLIQMNMKMVINESLSPYLTIGKVYMY